MHILNDTFKNNFSYFHIDTHYHAQSVSVILSACIPTNNLTIYLLYTLTYTTTVAHDCIKPDYDLTDNNTPTETHFQREL